MNSCLTPEGISRRYRSPMGALLSSGVERISSHNSSIVNWVIPRIAPGKAAFEALIDGCKASGLAPADIRSPLLPKPDAETFGVAVWYMLVAGDIGDASASAVTTMGGVGWRRSDGLSKYALARIRSAVIVPNPRARVLRGSCGGKIVTGGIASERGILVGERDRDRDWDRGSSGYHSSARS
jgi:hypothetical protein